MRISVKTWVSLVVVLILSCGYIFLPLKSIYFGGMTALVLILLLDHCTKESFLFEVSPERLKCMYESVDRNLEYRTCGCCRRGYYGAYIPGMQEWTTGDDWIRTDSYTTNPENIIYRDQTRPSTLVSNGSTGPTNSFTRSIL